MLNDLIECPNRQNWASQIIYILESHGFNDVWLFQGVGNMKQFIHIFTQRIKHNYIQCWNNQLQNSPRAITYRSIASSNFKQYLNTVVNTKYRVALTRLRVSSHRLEIEIGRWHEPNRIIRSERKCQHGNVLEDEFHFILECPVYHEIRSQLLNICIHL